LKSDSSASQKYERGDNRVSPDRLQRIAEVTRKPITYFFARSDAQEATAGDEVLAAVAKWMGSNPVAHAALRALSGLNGEDLTLAVVVLQRLAADNCGD
jgi:transcriptional regulator with XRE-family HTH domain